MAKTVTGASFFVTCLSKYNIVMLDINLKLCSSLEISKTRALFVKMIGGMTE